MVADGDRVVATGGLRRQQVHGGEVGLVDGQVDVLETEPLGGRACELVDAERTGLEQHLLGRVAGRAALFDGGLDALLRDEPELDDDVGDEPPGAAPPARGGDARDRAVARPAVAVLGTEAGDRCVVERVDRGVAHRWKS